MSESTNVVRLQVSDRTVTVNWSLDELRGEMLDVIEDYLGASVYGWLKRWQNALAEGVRLSEFRSKEIIALVYLGMVQEDPETTLRHVQRSVAPYAVEFLPTEEQPAQERPAPRTVEGPPPADLLVPLLPPPPAPEVSPLGIAMPVLPDGHHA